MDDRKGFLKPDQEKVVDDLIELNGIAEITDGLAIRMGDNYGLEAIKSKIVQKFGPEVLPDIYKVVDEIFEFLATVKDAQEG